MGKNKSGIKPKKERDGAPPKAVRELTKEIKKHRTMQIQKVCRQIQRVKSKAGEEGVEDSKAMDKLESRLVELKAVDIHRLVTQMVESLGSYVPVKMQKAWEQNRKAAASTAVEQNDGLAEPSEDLIDAIKSAGKVVTAFNKLKSIVESQKNSLKLRKKIEAKTFPCGLGDCQAKFSTLQGKISHQRKRHPTWFSEEIAQEQLKLVNTRVKFDDNDDDEEEEDVDVDIDDELQQEDTGDDISDAASESNANPVPASSDNDSAVENADDLKGSNAKEFFAKEPIWNVQSNDEYDLKIINRKTKNRPGQRERKRAAIKRDLKEGKISKPPLKKKRKTTDAKEPSAAEDKKSLEESSLHPSWIAKKLAENKNTIKEFSGTKIKFDNDDDDE